MDNFGYKNAGSYYLGEKGELFVPQQIKELLTKIIKSENIEKLVMVGSSKGGTSALYYGILMNAHACIIGTPQYYLGNYLNLENHKKILEGIMGNCDLTSVDYLNNIIPQILKFQSLDKPDIYIIQ